MIKTVKDIETKGKRVLLRTDYDIPLTNGKIKDDSRILASLPTLKYLIKNQADIITILCHLDRPQGKVINSLRVKPVALYLKKLLPKESPVHLQENLRFNPGEEKNDIGFAFSLAQNADIFINDAFAVSHRNHASIVSLPKLLPSAIGLHFAKELKYLNKVIRNPQRPLIIVVGGAKLETKLPLINKFLNLADKILVGGKLAAQLKTKKTNRSPSKLTIAELNPDGKDITSQSAHTFAEIIKSAGTVVWNGPMGIFEEKPNQQGTKIIAQAVNQSPGYSVIGGGDTESAATLFNQEANINHISMGGGAMLKYLAQGTLAGLQAIKNSKINTNNLLKEGLND